MEPDDTIELTREAMDAYVLIGMLAGSRIANDEDERPNYAKLLAKAELHSIKLRKLLRDMYGDLADAEYELAKYGRTVISKDKYESRMRELGIEVPT